MDDTKKKILLGILLIVATVVFAWGLWYFFFRAAPLPIEKIIEEAPPTAPPTVGLPSARPGVPGVPVTPPGEEAVPTAPTEIPEAAEAPRPIASPIASGGITQIATVTEHRIDAPQLTSNGRDLAYYAKDEGKFYRVTPDGTATPISDRAFIDVERVAWAPNAEKAILEFPDGANILYDFEKERQVTLPQHWTDFGFSPTGNDIAFKSLGTSPEDRWLAVGKPDGSGVTAVAPLGENEHIVTVNWSPNQQMIATYTKSRTVARQELFFVGKHEENFTLAVLEGRQFVGQWTPEGDRMLYSVAGPLTDLKPSLWIVDAAPGTSGQNRTHLDLQTWADKCAIAKDNRTAYCAVPTELPTGAGLIREVAENAPDVFYRLDLESGSKTLIAIPEETSVTAVSPVVTDDGTTLLFTNAQTGKLQKIRLK